MKNLLLLAGQIAILPLCAYSQNVGIGKPNPSVRLDVLSEIPEVARFGAPEDLYVSFYENNVYRGYIGSYAGNAEDVDFGTGSSNFSGKLHLTIRSFPVLTIASNGNVGIGTETPSTKLDVVGTTNLRSALQINGSPGTAGQVLTSNGNAAPIWQNSALTNTVRFGARYQRVGSGSSTLSLQSTYYNLSPGSITLGSGNITINKTGLYRLNGYTSVAVNGSFPEPPEATFDVNFGGAFVTQYDLLQWRPMTKRTAVNNNYYDAIPFELDIYLPAGTTITFNCSYNAGGTISYQEANIRVFGYLISD